MTSISLAEKKAGTDEQTFNIGRNQNPVVTSIEAIKIHLGASDLHLIDKETHNVAFLGESDIESYVEMLDLIVELNKC